MKKQEKRLKKTGKNVIYLLLMLPMLEACTPSLKSVQKKLNDREYAKASELIQKKEEKSDTPNVAVFFARAQLFADSLNSNFDMDKAYAASLKAEEALPTADEKTQKEFEKAEIGTEDVSAFRAKLEADAFAFFAQKNSEDAMNAFIDRFPEASQIPEAVRLRNSLAFSSAKASNTYRSYEDFLKKYPDAAQAEEARGLYEITLFQQKTKDGSLSSYENFLKEHPKSPYRKIVEQRIYETVVPNRDLSNFVKFVRNYPNSPFTEEAWAWIWYLDNENPSAFLKRYPKHPSPEGIRPYMAAAGKRLYPVSEDGKIGFADEEGKIHIRPQFKSLDEQYRCEGLELDFLVIEEEGKKAAFDITGKRITEAVYDEIEPLGKATLKVRKGPLWGVVHKGGFVLSEPEFQKLESTGAYTAYAKGKKFGLKTENMREVLPPEYDFIGEWSGTESLILQKSGMLSVLNKAQLGGEAKKNEDVRANQFFVHEEEKLLVFKNGRSAGVMAPTGKVLNALPADEVRILSETAFTLKKGSLLSLCKRNGEILDRNLTGVKVHPKGFITEKSGKFGVRNTDLEVWLEPKYDSVIFLNAGVWAVEGEKKWVFLNSFDRIDVSKYRRVEVTFYKDKNTGAESYLLVTINGSGKKGLIDRAGNRVLPERFDDISLFDEEVLIAERYGKRGLFDLSGSEILPLRYEGIAESQDGFYSLLLKRKFGLFNPKKKILIKPVSEALIQVYDASQNLFIVKKSKFGLVDNEGKQVAPFEFDEIRYWKPGKMLMRKGDRWQLYDIVRNFAEDEVFERMRYLKNTKEEIIIITYRPSGYGLLSNVRGRLMPEEYSDIRNLGTPDKPFYVAEKYISQGQLYVLLYIDENGKVVRKQTLEEKYYDALMCDD